jgi:site-specific recombinase XerD
LGLAIPAADAERARAYASAEKAKAYGADFQIFRAWCEEGQLDAVPASPATVAAFLAHEAGRNVKASTIGRRVAAIRYAHRLAGFDTPTDDERVKATVRGIRRTLGTARSKKAPATAERLLAMAANTGAGLKGLRDRALLLLGFAGAFRRSELVALDISDIEETPDGMKVTIRHSKTDQESAGQVIAIPLGKIACPIAALKEWTATASIQLTTAGRAAHPVFAGRRYAVIRLRKLYAPHMLLMIRGRLGQRRRHLRVRRPRVVWRFVTRRPTCPGG